MKRNNFRVLILIILVSTISPIAFVQATQPPSPPEIEIIILDSRYTSHTAPMFDQFIKDAALCGIKLTINLMSWYDIVMCFFSGNYDIIMSLTISWYQPDSLDTIIWLLDYYFGDTNYWNYHNELIKSNIQIMKDYYYNGFLEEAITKFHEIESIIFEEQSHPALGYYMDSSLIYTHQIIANNQPERPCNDIAIIKALSYLIDREFFISAMQYEYPYTLYQSSHLFGWSQFHDYLLPEIDHSIGKAKFTLASAGYLPRALK